MSAALDIVDVAAVGDKNCFDGVDADPDEDKRLFAVCAIFLALFKSLKDKPVVGSKPPIPTEVAGIALPKASTANCPGPADI